MPGRRTQVLGAVVILLGLPLIAALAGAVSSNIANLNNGVVVSSGEERAYLLYVPPTYDRGQSTSLVISLHGGGMWPAAQREISQWNRVADQHGFLVVYPAGAGPERLRAWRASGGEGSARDAQFIADLIDRLSAEYNIDPTRIYANGISNGGGMSFVLSCLLSDRIAAVGVVATAQFLPWSWCPVGANVPMIGFHGTADRQAWYRGGTSWVAPRFVFPDIRTFVAGWARRNRCEERPAESRVAVDVTRLEYEHCVGNADVVLYTVEGGGHTWPGGGPLPEWFVGRTSHAIDASARMWEFFREHPRSQPSH